MTELERLLTQSLTTLEQELTAALHSQDKTLDDQQHTLEAHKQSIQRLQESISRITAEQQESARHLQRLSDIHNNLEPLLSRLSALLNAR